MSALKKEMIEAFQEAAQPLYRRIDILTEEVRELKKASGDTVNISGACRLLKCDRSTFWEYRKVPGLIEPCGGTETRPVFFRDDVLKIREKLKAGLKVA